MAKPSSLRVCVIGAGLAGLAAAYDMARGGAEVQILDAADDLGGLASSVDLKGLVVERFCHFICRGDDDLLRLVGELGIADRVHWVQSKTAFFYNGILYPFATPMDLLRFDPVPSRQRLLLGLNVWRSIRRKDWASLDGISAKRWLINRLGQKAYDVVWDPLLRMKFGDYHEQVSAAWIWHRIMRVAASRDRLGLREQLGYLESGTETVIRALQSQLQRMPNVSIRTGVLVERVVTQDGRVAGLRLQNGETIDCAAVVSTAALKILERMAPELDKEYRHRLARIDYIGVVCGVLKLRQAVTDAFWVNVNDSRIPFNGIIEYTNLNLQAKHAIGGRSIVYVPCYLRTSSPRYDLSDAVLKKEFLDGLGLINPQFRPDWVEELRIYREPYAQAICTVGFASMIPDHRAPLPGLYLTDSTQYYPEDRTISAAIRLGRRVAQLIDEDTDGMARLPFPKKPVLDGHA